MKKRRLNLIISYILAAMMMITIVACGDGGKNEEMEVDNSTDIVMTGTDADTGNKMGEIVEATTSKVSVDSSKTDRKDTASAKEKKTTAKTESKTEKPTEQKTETKTEKKTETPIQAPTERRAEVPTQQRTEAPTEQKTEAPTQQRTEAPTEKRTEAPTQAPTEAPTEALKCSHNWVWKTHTETVHHDAVTHEETYLIGDAWDEDIYVEKTQCGVCRKIYESGDDYRANDTCMGNYGHVSVYDHTIHHDAEYGTDIVVDQPAYDEYVEVNDYQYCSKCGERK